MLLLLPLPAPFTGCADWVLYSMGAVSVGLVVRRENGCLLKQRDVGVQVAQVVDQIDMRRL